MKKYLLIILLTIVSPIYLMAQQPWMPSTIEEACVDDVYLILPPDSVRVAVEKSAGVMVSYNQSYHVSGPYNKGGRKYIRFQNDDADFRVVQRVAEMLLPHMVSHRYWQQRYNSMTAWSMVDMNQVSDFLDVDTSDQVFGHYSTLLWQGYEFIPSEDWPVNFKVVTNTGAPQLLTLRSLERLAKWGVFNTYQGYMARSAQENARNRIQQERAGQLQRQLDSLAGIGRWAGRQADSVGSAMQDDSVEAVQRYNRDEVERTKQRMNRDEIFIMNIKPAHSDYMFGLEYNFYNCFQKTITKIEITVTPYNARGRKQEDKFKRSTRTVRCMGPIRPGSPAQFLFDELFWDERGAIKYMRTTSITLYFTDGTVRHYSGYDKVMRHSLN